MAIAGVVFDDVLEQILVRLEVKDLIQCKRVCKSWYSLISSHSFVKFHLNYSCNNDLNYLVGHRRVASPTRMPEDSFYYNRNARSIVGSSNGLVCLKHRKRLLVTNPLTAELKIVLLPCIRRPSQEFCFGFGYDPYIDDYKVVVGVMDDWVFPEVRSDVPTSFHVFRLNGSSTDWRLIGQVSYGRTQSGRPAILCDGSLHWFMRSYQNDRKVILSLDLSTEEFTEIPLPESDEYECNNGHRLGIIQGCLCIYNCDELSSSNIWMYNKQQSWELFPCDYEIQNVVHYLRTPGDHTPHDNGCHGICSSTNWDFIRSPIFVQSLVSPHANSNKGRSRQPTKYYVGLTRTNKKKRSVKTLSYCFHIAKPFPFSRFSQTILKWKKMKRWNFEGTNWPRLFREKNKQYDIYKSELLSFFLFALRACCLTF